MAAPEGVRPFRRQQITPSIDDGDNEDSSTIGLTDVRSSEGKAVAEATQTAA